jgi:hypothetical protein
MNGKSMSLAKFSEQINKSKAYIVSELYLSSIPAELYKNNSMSIPATAERDLKKTCLGKFATDKDEADYCRLLDIIANKKPLYPFYPTINAKDVVGMTLVSDDGTWTLNRDELKEFAALQIFGTIDTPTIKINSKSINCIKGEFSYVERGGKVIHIYQQTVGIQTIPAVSASYINIIENGKARKIRISGTLAIPALKVPLKYQKFLR